MDAAVSSLPRPPLSHHLRSPCPACVSSLHPSSRHRDGPRPRFRSDRGAFFGGHSRYPFPSLPPLRNNLPRRRSPKGAVAFWEWSGGRRKRGRKGGGLDRAAVARWASFFLLADSIRRLLVLQPTDILAVFLEHGEGVRIGGRDGALGILRRGLSGGGHTRRRWKRALGLAAKVVAAAAAAAAIWLLLFGRGLL